MFIDTYLLTLSAAGFAEYSPLRHMKIVVSRYEPHPSKEHLTTISYYAIPEMGAGLIRWIRLTLVINPPLHVSKEPSAVLPSNNDC
jgi:hypothetical protein